MTNIEIALVLKEIANFLKLKEDNPYRVRAYQKGAQIIERQQEDIVRLVQENRLDSIEGIGEKLASQVEEIIKTGRCSFLEELKSEFPAILKSILGIPGVGTKTARIIFNNLEIKSLNDLKKACESGEVRRLPSLGKKTEKNILQGIEKLEKQEQRHLLGLAFPFAKSLLNNIREFDEVEFVELAGSIRRKQETVKDIDVIVITNDNNRQQVKDKIIDLPLIRQILKDDGEKISFLNIIGLKVDVFMLSESKFPLGWIELTGNKEHVEMLKERVAKKNLEISLGGKLNKESVSEEDVYSFLDLQYIPPELREGKDEINLAEDKNIPDLVEKSQLKGDLHIHTNWSDGTDSLEDMAYSAKNKGYEYIAVTDHSRSLSIAGGLSIDELKNQTENIRKLNEEKQDSFKIFSGVEADILNDGSLDYPDEILKELDFVIGSIHQGFGQDQEKITKRVLLAMENPYVRVIAHPLGRLINKREGHKLDLERIFEKAIETGTALEINSSVDRLDLPFNYVKKAKEYGIKFVINTDAHDTNRLEEIKYGVFVARKGYLEQSDVINTMSLDELNLWLKEKKPGREQSER
ncbi:DNA polymerase/3'-5' exonuclease PolX [Natranaerofaba carboxydovora]|uniref:DNA polymerase/3'-5' exonuclease PolX n=1 Tax=Natranaerofaba carboxydovora TaxID=2742683 RepID=UPI001F13A083|nr:DNA polymerase/3'-5' exonuclease PolX [Natranaerofaba carboxydovora]UMZ74041.1 DNA polymerase/3'-5' exonuclease PolX [Natranaerofaba carboxydovora]